MKIIPTVAPTFGDCVQTCTNCVTTPFDALLGQYCTAGNSTVYLHLNPIELVWDELNGR